MMMVQWLIFYELARIGDLAGEANDLSDTHIVI